MYKNKIEKSEEKISSNTITENKESNEKVLRELISAISSTLDINEIIHTFVFEIGKILNAQKVFFSHYDEATNTFLSPEEAFEYRESADIHKYKNMAKILDNNFPFFCGQIKTTKEIMLIPDVAKLVKERGLENSVDAESLKKYTFNSAIAFPVVSQEKLLGFYGIEYRNATNLDQSVIDFLITFSRQTVIAMNQANLLEREKKNREREAILRKTIETIRSPIDIELIKHEMVQQIGAFLKADRVAFVDYDSETKKYSTTPKNEYRSSSKVPTFVGHNYNAIPGFIENIREIHMSGRDIIFDNLDEYIEQNNLRGSGIDEFYRTMGFTSSMAINLNHGDVFYGNLVVTFEQQREITKDDIEYVKTLAVQVVVAIDQAELYSKIAKNENYTRTILENIKEVIIILNEEFIIESCNPAIEDLWGYSVPEVIGKRLDLLLLCDCEKTDEDEGLPRENSTGIRKNGEEFPVDVDISKIEVENKKLTLLVARDITERKKIDKMKSEFVSTVSHELRTPLTAIKGSLGLITSGVFGVLPEKVSSLINIANNNCIRLTNLINDILDLEKIKAGKYDFIYEELEINSLLEQSYILNQSYAEEFGMQIKLIKPAQKIYVKADKNRTLQVISNLISNAVKFSKLGGEVKIIFKTTKNKVKISVIDNGIGISEDSKFKIFQAFSQIDSSDTRSKGGTGLGLSISKLIIESMGGNIGFESEVDKGSTFFFTLPIIEKGSFIKEDDKTVKELCGGDF